MISHKLNLPAEVAQYEFWNKLIALPFVKSVYLFGSRARGDARSKSDIDIAVNCPEASFQQWQEVLDIIEDADTLLGIDVVRYDNLNDNLFKRKIDESKVVVYETETHDAMSFFSKALLRFTEALAEDQSNPLAIDGSIQRFEFCFELGWKLLKKMLMDIEGIEALSPKKALQFAYQLGWIEDEQAWLKMLNDRSLTSHTYRDDYAQEIYSQLPHHLKSMQLLQNRLTIVIQEA